MNEGVPCLLLPYPDPGSQEIERLYMSKPMAAKLGLRDGAVVTLRIPSFRVPMRITLLGLGPPPGFISTSSEPSGTRISDRGRNSNVDPVYISRPVLQRLRLPAGWPLRLKRSETGELHIGPIVGIFCQRYPGPALYGPQTRFFRRLIEMGRRKHMFIYVFETNDLDRRTEAIAGSTWLAERGWVRRACPLPHAFYDRGMVNQSVMRAHQWLRLRGVRQFNGYVGSKLWVYRLVAEIPKLARYIPPTKVLRHTGDLTHMVKEHGTVYVKSAGGGKGIGIWVVSPHPRRGYTYRFTDAKTRIRRGTAREPGVIVQRLLHAPRQPWFIQPRLDLLRWRGRIFDVRVLVQRDGHGALQVTGTSARVGRKGSIISNIHGGGDARALPPLLQEGLGLNEEQAQAMQAKIEDIALEIARVIDRAVRQTGTVAELGIDIAIDQAGRLWFLEANSRTGRNVFVLSGMNDRARVAMERPLQYAEHVAGFGG